MNRNGLAISAVAGAALTLSFSSSFGLFRFHDDWTFMSMAAAAVQSGTVPAFVARPLEQHWTPGWHLLEAANFAAAGWESDGLIRSLILVCTALSLVVCCRVLRTLGIGAFGQAIAVAVLALHPAAAAARFSFDTYSQVLVDLIGWTATAYVIRALLTHRGITARTAWGALGIAAAGLLIKEQALSGSAAVAMVVCAGAWREGRWQPSVSERWLLIGLVAIAAVYGVARRGMGVVFQPSGNPFSLCIECVPANVVQLSAAVLMPVRTLVWFDALRATPPNRATLVAVAVAAVTVCTTLVFGIAWSVRRDPARVRAAVFVGCAAVAAYFPVSLLAHVGELYTHTIIFWLAVAAGWAADTFWRTRHTRMRVAIAAAAAAYVVSLAAGQRSNLEEMRLTGERARGWITRIAAATRSVPDGAVLVVVSENAYKAPTDYGLYRLTTPNTLVLTGLAPSAVRYAVRQRLTVILANVDGWEARVRAASAGRDDVYLLTLGRQTAQISPFFR
jgi:hypothetical protein